jgi:quercetin dioxygenase-like cupin family protein
VKPAQRDFDPSLVEQLQVPSGFRVNVFAQGLGKPRMMAVAEDGTVYVTRPESDDVLALRDSDGDGRADEPRTVVADLKKEAGMGDKSVTKIASKHSPKGEMGQKYLASGVHVAMRLWESESPGEPKPTSQREYETVGYVIKGRAELHIEGQKVLLEPGDSWVVPQGSVHTYKILESFTAVEATYPPAQVHGRDEA